MILIVGVLVAVTSPVWVGLGIGLVGKLLEKGAGR